MTPSDVLEPGMITVLLVDDQALVRTAVGELVAHEDGLAVVGEATNGVEAVEQVRSLRPDIVLMDIRMPVLDGLAATRIVVLTTFEEDEYVLQALRAGASGFIGKGAEAAQLMDAIRTVHNGEALLSPRATQTLIDRFLASATTPEFTVPPELALLTERERQILLLVGQGLSNVEIAELLVISPQTVKTHLNRVMTKLHAHDRAQLVIIAYESRLLKVGQT